MKRLSNILATTLLAGLAAILVLLPFHAFLSTWGGTAVGPLLVWKSWKEILLLVLLPVAICYLCLRPDVARTLWSRLVNRVVLVFAGVVSVGIVLSPASFEALAAGAMFDLRFLAIFLLAQIVAEAKLAGVEKLKKWCGPALLGATVLLGILAIIQVYGLSKEFLVQFGYDKDATIAPFILVDQNQDALRAFATMRGPNTLGAYLLLPIALALALIINQRRNWFAWAAIGFGGIAVFLTGSRSAWLGVVATAVILLALNIPRKKLGQFLVWAVPTGLVLAGTLLTLALTVPAVRLAVFHSSPGDPTLFEGSTEQHWQATLTGIKDVIAHPLGQGVGTAGPASFYDQPKLAENYFVQIGQEVGAIGFGIFVAICVLIALQLWRTRAQFWSKVLLASFVGLTGINMLLHGWADDPTAMTWWALAGLFAFNHERKIKS